MLASLAMIPAMIVPVLRFYDKLQQMLDTIDFPIGHIIVIDNGGLCGELSCRSAGRLSVVRMPSNLGVPTSWNLGVQLEPFAEYWLFSQDDILWNPGGLERVHSVSNADVVGLGLLDARPFSSFTVGENVFRKTGLFDESYFPLIGDDFNFHKRCHFHGIDEVDISGSYRAEKSATIRSMLEKTETSQSVLVDNYVRSVYGPPLICGWKLDLRRNQGSGLAPRHQMVEELDLDHEYEIHNDAEERAFDLSISVHRSAMKQAGDDQLAFLKDHPNWSLIAGTGYPARKMMSFGAEGIFTQGGQS